MFGCPTSRTRCPALSFYRIRALGGKTTDSRVHEWREMLLRRCERVPPFNMDTAHICSRHFEDSCFEYRGKLNIVVDHRV